MKNFFLLIVTVLCFYSCKLSSETEKKPNTLQSIIDEFDQQLAKDVVDDYINGSISAAIVKGDQILWSNAYGTIDSEGSKEADTNSIYRTGSISKPFTAFLMMQLVEEGIIQLDNPVEKYMPEVKELQGYSEHPPITFKQLSNHTSGLIREPRLQNAAKGPIENWEDKILESIPNTSFQSAPGERYSYSNIGFGMLGLALSRAAGQSFVKMVEDKIFKPLGMVNSFWIVPEAKMSNLAKGMSGGPQGELNKIQPQDEHSGRGYKVPNGGIYSTPNDLAKFMMANMGHAKILTPANLAAMQVTTTPDDGWRRNYGIGFSLYQDETVNLVKHGGSVAGYNAHFMFDKDSQYGVILMRNYNWGTTNLELRSLVLLRKLNAL